MGRDSLDLMGYTWWRATYQGTVTTGADCELWDVELHAPDGKARPRQHVHPEDTLPISAIDLLAELSP